MRVIDLYNKRFQIITTLRVSHFESAPTNLYSKDIGSSIGESSSTNKIQISSSITFICT
jgi:hypothetical protein